MGLSGPIIFVSFGFGGGAQASPSFTTWDQSEKLTKAMWYPTFVTGSGGLQWLLSESSTAGPVRR